MNIFFLNAQDIVKEFQDINSSCAFDKMHNDHLNKNKKYRERFQEREREILERTEKKLGEDPIKAEEEDVLTVPVVIHVVHRDSVPIGLYENYSDSLIEARIAEVNSMFAHESGTLFNNPHAGRNTNIKFCLATKDTIGNPTTGIVRHVDDVLTFDVVDVWSGPVVPAYQWNPEDYLNIFIVTQITGFGAYANLAMAHGETYDGVVIGFQMSPESWAHELGHYLNLYHVFNEGYEGYCPQNNNCLINGDRVCDTPPMQLHFLDCADPSVTRNSCSNDAADTTGLNPFGNVDFEDPIRDYMSYDYCKQYFTEGQKIRMRDALLNQRSSLLQSNGCTPNNNNHDVAIVDINKPNGLLCQDRTIPEITIANYGIQTLTSAEIIIHVDGTLENVAGWTGSLASGESETISLPELYASFGEHTYKVTLQNPNGYGDQFPGNNILTQNLLRVDPIFLPVRNYCQFSTFNNTVNLTSGVPDPGCDNYQGNDTWFELIVPGTGHIICEGLAVDFPNGGMALYGGDCNDLKLLVCEDYGASGYMPKIEMHGLTPGERVYLRFWEYGNDEFGDFKVCAYEGNGETTDLTITDFYAHTASSTPYAGLQIYTELKNIGSILNDFYTIGYYLSTDQVLDGGDQLLDQHWAYKISTSETKNITTGLYLPGPGLLADGNYYLIAKTDFINKVVEQDESNNIAITPLQITSSSFDQADVYTDTHTVFPPVASPNESLNLGCFYRNGGLGATGTTYLRYFISNDTIWDYQDTYLGGKGQYGMLPSKSQYMYGAYTVPNLPDGTYYIIFASDENNNVYEANELNNASFVPFEIKSNKYVSQIQIKVFLEGFMNGNTGQMTTKLVEERLVPGLQPYWDAPWNYLGPENFVYYPPDMVDWVMVEVRKGIPGTGTEPQMELVERRAGILNKYGWIKDVDGVTSLKFYNIDPYQQENYYFVVRHRTHLDIMTQSTIVTPIGQVYDFSTSQNKAYGAQQQKLINNVPTMYAADYDCNGIINNLDFNSWFSDNANVDAYVSWDGDGNGIVNNLDYNLWANIKSKVGVGEIYLPLTGN